MKKDDLSISYSELMKTLDEFRGKRQPHRELSPEQKKFIIKCREHERPVSYRTMAELWNKMKWPKITESTIRNIYLRDVKGQ